MRTPSSLGKRFDHQIAKAMAFMPANIPNTSVHPKFPSINNLSAQKPQAAAAACAPIKKDTLKNRVVAIMRFRGIG
jgi:hypothetical protein